MRDRLPKHLLHVVYILPSRYDDEGYVHRYWRGILPSNTLLCLKSLTQAIGDSGALGKDVTLSVSIYDDNVQRVPVRRILRRSRKAGAKLLVGLAGVQSNQFARATDLAAQFRAEGVAVMIGGFHVSGSLAMFPAPTPELQRLLDMGVTLVRGEAEAPGALAGILQDALKGRLKPIYEILESPDLRHAAIPQPDPAYMRRFVFRNMGTIDTSRGCPFNCSFCTIINVQGRKMRHRSPDTILASIEANHARGVNTYFFTDDNLARSPVWEPLFDGLARLRAAGKRLHFMMQVDTQAWRLPHFVEKAAAAGCYLVFIGMETVNPANIAAAGKRQNKVHQFAEMVAGWHDAGILVNVGYILGFPHDTPDTVRRDLAVLTHQIKTDEAAFFMLTPLPGSRDHQRMVQEGIPMDADLNNFDSFHETFRHERLQPGQWQALYEEAWETFYSKAHMLNLLLHAPQGKYWRLFWLCCWNRYSVLLKSHPMITGFVRLKGRRERRALFPRERWFAYARRRTRDMAQLVLVLARIFFEFQELWMLSRKPQDQRWATLAYLHTRWTEAQHAISETHLTGHCEVAMQELRSALEALTQHLRQLPARGAVLGEGARRKLQRQVEEAERYCRALPVEAPSWRQVAQAQHFLQTTLLAEYEAIAIRYVARRRELNAYRAEVLERLKSWRILTLDIGPMPRYVCSELYMATRFVLAFCLRRQESSSPPTASFDSTAAG